MHTRVWILSALLIASVASTAAAQGQPEVPQTPGTTTPTTTTTTGTERPTFEIGLGYQVLRAGELCLDDSDTDCTDSQTYPLGFAIDGVRNFGALGLVGELGWSRDSDDITDVLNLGTTTQNLFHYAVGVRWTGHNTGRVWPYGQFLVGGLTQRSSLDFDDEQVDDVLGDSDTRTHFMIQPGIGATIVVGDGWGVFGQVDYRRLFLDEDEDGASGRNDMRVFLGVRVILD